MTVVILGAVLIAYLIGSRRVHNRRAWFLAGWTALAIGLVAIDPWADQTFTGHMVQHELLMVVAAPLLVSARPLAVLMWALPRNARHRVGEILSSRVARSSWTLATKAPVAWLVQAVLLWTWHVPGLFQAAIEHPFVHALQHICFFGAAVLFWWSVLGRGRRGAVLSLFTTAVQSGVLGALLAFSPYSWYPAYGLDDQHMAGLVMWIPGGVAYLGAALSIMRRLLVADVIPRHNSRDADSADSADSADAASRDAASALSASSASSASLAVGTPERPLP